MTDETRAPRWPTVFENWRASASCLSTEAFEFPLFTDAVITGGPFQAGPYLFLNPVAALPPPTIQPALFVRVEIHLGEERLPMNVTDARTYHGGDIRDEIASLASLALGVRMKAGSVTRRFTPRDADLRGSPIAHEGFGEPHFLRQRYGQVLPHIVRSVNLDALQILARLPNLSPRAGIALTRSARLYQESIWLCEAEPALAWLLMVSAVECAADYHSGGEDNPAERLRAAKPQLAELIEARCPELLIPVAHHIVESLGATQKFIKFLLQFLPAAPEVRPSEGYRVGWTKTKLRPVLSRIYDYRSKALHAGVPFPAPMCEPPRRTPSGAPEERPSGLATATRDSVWLAEDLPLHFHVFEHLARNALLKWWCTLLNSQGSP